MINRRPWLIRQSNTAHVNTLIFKAGNSITSVLIYLRKELKKPRKAFAFEDEKPAIVEAIKFAKQNQRLLMAFRPLLRRWLKLRTGNDEDLVTGEVPKNPIVITTWSERRRYVFEPTTILRDMCARILQHSFLFPKFLLPRNPYTNLDLTQAQFFSVVKQLRRTGTMHWVVEALYSVQYDMERFKAQFSEAVKRTILTNQFKNLEAPDTIDIIHEFIEDQHDEHRKKFNGPIYTWALTRANHIHRIKRWTKMCKDYYTAINNIHDSAELQTKLVQLINSTQTLCSHPTELVNISRIVVEESEESEEETINIDQLDLAILIFLETPE